MPHIGSGKFGNRGQGVQQQRDQIPHVHDHNSGKGVSMQRDKMPMVQTSSSGGKGVSQHAGSRAT